MGLSCQTFHMVLTHLVGPYVNIFKDNAKNNNERSLKYVKMVLKLSKLILNLLSFKNSDQNKD